MKNKIKNQFGRRKYITTGAKKRTENKEGEEESRTISGDLFGAMGRCRSYLRQSEPLPQFTNSKLRIRVFLCFLL